MYGVIYLLLFVITNRFWLTTGLYSTLVIVFAIATRIKVALRDEPVLPADLTTAGGNAGEVGVLHAYDSLSRHRDSGHLAGLHPLLVDFGELPAGVVGRPQGGMDSHALDHRPPPSSGNGVFRVQFRERRQFFLAIRARPWRCSHTVRCRS